MIGLEHVLPHSEGESGHSDLVQCSFLDLVSKLVWIVWHELLREQVHSRLFRIVVELDFELTVVFNFLVSDIVDSDHVFLSGALEHLVLLEEEATLPVGAFVDGDLDGFKLVCAEFCGQDVLTNF